MAGSPQNKSLFKKLAIIFGALFGLFVLTAILVPFFVDVDKYRPTIVSEANKQINGKLELGHLDLSLWGQVKIKIDGLKLSDSRGRTVVQVKDASFNLPFWSILIGSPVLRLQLVNPEISIVKGHDGKMNATTIVKSSGKAETPKAEKPSEPVAIPAIALRSKLTLLLEDAKLAYIDKTTGDTYKVDELNVRLEDVSPSSEMPFEITADLDLLVQKKIKVEGPLVFEGLVKAESNGASFDTAHVKAALKLDDVKIEDPSTFNKGSGVPLGFDLKAVVTKNTATLSELNFRLADVTISGKGDFKTAGKAMSGNVSIQSNEIDVAKLGDLSPLVKEYGLNGLIKLAAKLNMQNNKYYYGANLSFKKIILEHDSMLQPLNMSGAIKVATDEIRSLVVKLNAKNFDMKLSGGMQGFTRPRFKFNLASKEMNLDTLLKASKEAKEARKSQAKAEVAATKSGKASKTEQVVDYNAMFKPLRENPIAAAAAGRFGFRMNKVISTGVQIDKLKGDFHLNALNLALKNFSMHLFKGSMAGGMTFNVRPKKPVVGVKMAVNSLSTKAMLESQTPFAKNTMTGIISSNMTIGGSGLNNADIISGWKGNGFFNVKDAHFTTMDIGNEIDKAIAGQKFLKGKVKVPGALKKWKGEYKTINTKFTLAKGTFFVDKITGKSYPNKGMDLDGNGKVQLADYGLNMTVFFIDRWDMLPEAKKIAPAREYGGHFALKTPISGNLFSPKFQWSKGAGYIVKNARKHQQKRLAGKVEKKVAAKIKKAVPKKVMEKPQVKKAAKKLKGLFGR